MKRLVIAFLTVAALLLPIQAASASPTTYDTTVYFSTGEGEAFTPGTTFEVSLKQPSGATKIVRYKQENSLTDITKTTVPDLESGTINWTVDIYIPNERQEDPAFASGTFVNSGAAVELKLNDYVNLDVKLEPLAGNALKGYLSYLEPEDSDMSTYRMQTNGPGYYRFTVWKSSHKSVLQYSDFSSQPHIVGYPQGATRQQDARLASDKISGTISVFPQKRSTGTLSLSLKDAYGKTPSFKLITRLTPLASDIAVQSVISQPVESSVPAKTNAVSYPLKSGRYKVEVIRVVDGVYRTLFTKPDVVVKNGKTTSVQVRLTTQAINRKSASKSKVSVSVSGDTKNLKSTVRLISKKNSYEGVLSKGKKTFTRVEPGKYKVEVDGFIQKKSVTVKKDKTAKVPTFKATGTRTISGVARSAKGVTLKSTTVELLEAGSSKVISTTLTNSKGKYQFSGAKKGKYVVRVWASPKHSSEKWNATTFDALAAGYRNTAVTVSSKSVKKNLKLRAVSTVTGRVLDASGRAVPNLAVKVTAKGHQSQTAYTDAQGKFSFKNVSRTKVYFLVGEANQSAHGVADTLISRNITKSKQSVTISVK